MRSGFSVAKSTCKLHVMNEWDLMSAEVEQCSWKVRALSESQSSVHMSPVYFTQLNKVSIQGILENIFWYFLASLGVLWDNSEHCLG